MKTSRTLSRVRIVSCVAVLLLAACSGPRVYRVHGAPDFEGESVSVGELLDAPQQYDGRTVVVHGEVSEVCQNRGCWMLLEDGGREVRITFKDPEVFVPKDCAGSEVEAKGVFAVVQIPADLAAHYLHDAGRDAEAAAITGPVPSFTLVATGARIRLH
jgi:Domain of unknown function (DUF4920)